MSKFIIAGVVLLAYALGTYFSYQKNILEVVFKGLATLTLFVSIWIYGQNGGLVDWWTPILIGVGFALLGDLFLTYQKFDVTIQDLFFQLGLGSFLIGYLIFGITFFVNGDKSNWLVYAVFLVLAGISTWQYFSMNNIGEGLEIPVMVYLIQATILVTGAVALFLNGNVSLFQGVLILICALSFYVSDSLIGHNLFGGLSKANWAEASIMSTYAVGHLSLFFALFK